MVHPLRSSIASKEQVDAWFATVREYVDACFDDSKKPDVTTRMQAYNAVYCIEITKRMSKSFGEFTVPSEAIRHEMSTMVREKAQMTLEKARNIEEKDMKEWYTLQDEKFNHCWTLVCHAFQYHDRHFVRRCKDTQPKDLSDPTNDVLTMYELGSKIWTESMQSGAVGQSSS